MSGVYLLRVGFLIRNISRFSFQGLTHFSSQSPAINPKLPQYEAGEEGGGRGSAVYRKVLRRQRPTNVRWNPELYNSVSFIGRVDRPLETCKTSGDNYGAYTFIKVKNPSDPTRTFRVHVELWDYLAKIGTQHLKRNDDIYVSGSLGSYAVADEKGNFTKIYKVIAKELCYVARHNQCPTFQKPEESQSNGIQKSEKWQIKDSNNLEESQSEGENGMEIGRYEDHLNLWQMFFCKPYEWWDKRKSKKSLEAPDFKHKYNGENLWLRPDDPPWVRRQLQLLDMEIAKQRQVNGVGDTDTKRYNNCHHLWQVFFSNPHEWWDNRKNKKHRQAPDFKHKDTGEALWMSPDDPEWVKRQLQLIDSIMAEQCFGENACSFSQPSKWIFDD